MYEKNARCIDGCCVCNTGFQHIDGSCVPGNLTLCMIDNKVPFQKERFAKFITDL